MAPLRPFLCRTGIISHRWPDTAHSLLRRLRRNGRGEPQGSHFEYLWSKPAQHRQQDSWELSEWWHRGWAQLPDGSCLGGRVETDARKLGQRTGEAQHKASREGYGYLCVCGVAVCLLASLDQCRFSRGQDYKVKSSLFPMHTCVHNSSLSRRPLL